MIERFLIKWVTENENSYYKVYDKVTGQMVCCNKGELNEMIWKVLGV